MAKPISKILIESFGYQLTEAERAALLDPQVAARVAARMQAAGKPALGGVAGKVAGKIIPGIGAGLEAKDAYEYAKKGDWVGAGLSGLAGAAYLVPGYGWAAGLGLDAVKMARDQFFPYKSDDKAPDSAPSTSTEPQASGKPQTASSTTANNKISQVQKTVGAHVDGIMGPETKQKLQAWQSAHNLTADGIPGPETMAAISKEHARFVQLQKVIGANPDGFMGPDTKQKLQAWQSAHNLTADGIPGPDTYKAAVISEGLNVVDSIVALRNRLAMLEAEDSSDPAVIVNKDDELYAVLPDGRLIDQDGNVIDGSKPDLPVIGHADDVDSNVIFSVAR